MAMSIQEKVYIITSAVEAGTIESLPQSSEMELIPNEKLKELCRTFQPEEKVCITSEYSLSTVVPCLDPGRRKAVEVLKDKVLFRRTLKEIFPQYDFRSFNIEEISCLKVLRKSVIKPAKGIFGTAVRVVGPETDLLKLSRELEEEIRKNTKVYPDSVLSVEDFLLEDFIEGEEYAVDMFYDSKGEPQIVNIMHHPLPANDAYLHMLYNSSKKAFDEVYVKAKLFFRRLNEVLQVRNFLMHSELRLSKGEIVPVEINCMRFGGMGLCNLVYHSMGVNPFLCFLNDQEPKWESLWKGRENTVFSFFIAYNGANINTEISRPLPEKLKERFSKVLLECPFDHHKQLAFGIFFLEETEENIKELLKLEFDDFFEAL
jgi:hypothetical protein